jgi:hypothetical protein
MLKNVAHVIVGSLLLSGGIAFAQERLACAMLKGLDLKPLLGADHDAPVPFGKESCRAESKSPGKIVVLAVVEGTVAEHKSAFATIKEINAKHRAKEVRVVPEPSLGPDAFSIRERSEMRQIEIFAIKGSRAITFNGGWAVGKPIDDAGTKQFVALVKAALDKLP